MSKLAEELILKAKAELLMGRTLEADRYHRAATQIAQDEALIARVKALIPANPELIEAGYFVPAADLLAALKAR